MSSRLALQVFFAPKILSWESPPISLECATSVEKVETLQLPLQSSVAFMGRVFPDSERCASDISGTKRGHFWRKDIFQYHSFGRLDHHLLEAGREGRKGGRVISDGFGFLRSCGTSHQWPAQPPLQWLIPGHIQVPCDRCLLPLISNSFENLLWPGAQVWRSNSVLDQTCKESGKVTGSAGCYFYPLLCCLLSRLVF